jgi:hypothetical protein
LALGSALFTTCERTHPTEAHLEHIARSSLDWRRYRRPVMASEDFLVLTDMIYNKGWSIKKITHTFHKDSGEKSTIVLTKDGEIQTIESSAEDFLTFAHQHQQIVNARGGSRLAKIRDSNKYWNDIEKLVDTDGGKVNAATKSLLAGEFKFSFKPYEGIRKILQDRIPTDDPDVRAVKTHFFETLAGVVIESRQLLKIQEFPKKINPTYAGYASTYEKTLRHGFLGEADKTNIIDAYKKYVEAIQIDHDDLLRRIQEQERYVEFLRQLLVSAGKADLQNGARAILDAYWRLCEVCYPMLYIAYVAIAFRENKILSRDRPSFEDLVASLENNPDTKSLVEGVEPVLRNSEAHCASSIIMENGHPVVIAYDSRSNPAREIKRYSLSQVTNKVNLLAKSLLGALSITLELFEHAFLLLVLNSYEFKMRLVTLDQY